MADGLFTGPNNTWEAIRAQQAIDEAKRLRARVAELEQTVDGIWRYAVDETVADHHFRGWAEVEARAALEKVGAATGLNWENTSRNTWQAPLPVYGRVRVESYGGGTWGINASAPGICEILIEGAFPTAEDGMAAANAFVAERCRQHLATTQTHSAALKAKP